MNVTKILQMREGGHVKRCHCIHHHGTYDVAQHSFNMLLLLDELWPEHPRHVWKYVLRHDLFERWTGDTPYCAKALMPDLKIALKRAEAMLSQVTGIPIPDLSPYEESWVKALDWIEFLMWCDEQIGMGYVALKEKQQTVWDGLRQMNIPIECAQFLEKYKWERTPDDLS